MRPLTNGYATAACVLFCGLASSSPGQEWTRFRGPNGSGVSECTTIPVKWTEADYRWRARLPGKGHSSPVVWDDRVFLLSADPQTATRFVLCYSAVDGRQLWLREYASKPYPLHQRNTYAASTPAVDDERVYVALGSPEQVLLKAFDHDGREVWTRDLGRWVGQHGFGASPIVYQEMVILHNAQQAQELDPGQEPGQSTMVAVDRRTGQEIWLQKLPTVRVCYSVPLIYEPKDGPAELVCTSTGNGIFSLNPTTGEQNWSVPAFTMRVVNSPILAAGLVFGSNGSGGHGSNYLVAVRPGSSPALAYPPLKSSGKVRAPYVPCFLSQDEVVFLIHDQGFAACIEATTGNVRWFERMGGTAAFSGSPIRVRDRIYCIDEQGVVHVVAADPTQYRLLARNPLGEASRSTPAVSGGRMFLRTESQLFCVGSEQLAASGRSVAR